jgi:ribosomal RNA-processing protein 9
LTTGHQASLSSKLAGHNIQASGAGDGLIRLWAVEKGATGLSTLRQLGSLPARGFVNGLAIARSGRFLVAAMGQEPRLGRWLRDGSAKNGTLLHSIPLL